MIQLCLLCIISLMNVGLLHVNGQFKCNKQFVPCGCGLNHVDMSNNLIYSGEVVPYSWSMVVSLQYDCHHDGNIAAHCCTATILSESYVLTSAQCVDRIDSSSILAGKVSVLAGVHTRSEQDGTVRTIDHIYIHPKWTRMSDGYINDIAILHLSEPFDFDKNIYITRTCPSSRLNFLNEDIKYTEHETFLSIVSWNSTQTTGSLSSETLQQIAMYFNKQRDSRCDASIKNAEMQFCAEVQENMKGSYQSTLGSAAFQWIGDRWEQVGIVSLDMFAPFPDNRHQRFTRIGPFYEWIQSILGSLNSKTAVEMKTSPPASSAFRKYPTHYRCNRKTVSCGCSREQVQISPSAIFSSENSIANSWSMVASLRFNGTNQHACGGSILSDYFILTAAHCVDKLPKTSPTGVTVAAGIHERLEGGIDIMEVDQIYIHPNWTGSSDGYQNDIAILHLSQSMGIDTNPFLERTCVPYVKRDNTDLAQYPPSGTRLAIIGWGAIQHGANNLSDALRQTEAFVLNNNNPRCRLSLKNNKTQFCAGLNSGIKDTCTGDSGGPILEWKGKWWQQVGIASYRSSCGMDDQPNIYTRLAYYFDWMETVINESLTTTTMKPPVTNSPVTYTCDKEIPCGCGYNDVVLPPSRIVGGYDAIPYSWSMVVSLRRLTDNRHICGGSILSEFFILTAAHCVMNRQTEAPTNLFVAVGSNKQSEFSQIPNEVDRIYMHPEWVPSQTGNWNDIAILHLSQSLNISTNPFIKRTCLQRFNSSTNMLHYPGNGTRLAVIGWGLLEDEVFGETPEDLQQVEIFAMDKRDEPCDKTIKDKARQFCAGIPIQGDKDSCRGDSGGPILEWKQNRWEQIGIVSYGVICADPRYPTVFTQVANYIDWIEKVINESLAISHSTATVSHSTTTVSHSTTTVPGAGATLQLYSTFLLLFPLILYRACHLWASLL
ncbi:unnamed protein product [Rotaria magnacalcarata]|uniref:Peptidase S1 domain-containing protein n=1 Tax=Rotaria magnacalcarata TaxID=392030 RepID=A0A815GJK4_9BILA|nr:unnamed protein product [Rotaria magnacalcarata]CAF3978942.1 unnamed protein product [Rotaria magnacalcarata]